MKIMLVGTFSGMTRAANFWASSPSTDYKFSIGFKKAGHEVIEVDVCGKTAAMVKDEIINKLEQEPAVVVFGNVTGFLKQHLSYIYNRINEKKAKKIIWHGDIREHLERDVMEAIRHVDAFFLTSGGVRLEDYKRISKVKIAAWIFNPCINFDLEGPPSNNDIVLCPNWDRKMLQALDGTPNSGVVCPTSNFASFHQKPNTKTQQEPDNVLKINAEIERSGKAHASLNSLSGFFMMFRREMLDKTGPFNEGFEIGLFEDNYFFKKVIQSGKLTVVDGKTFIYHYGSRTFKGENIDMGPLFEKNKAKFNSLAGQK